LGTAEDTQELGLDQKRLEGEQQQALFERGIEGRDARQAYAQDFSIGEGAPNEYLGNVVFDIAQARKRSPYEVQRQLQSMTTDVNWPKLSDDEIGKVVDNLSAAFPPR